MSKALELTTENFSREVLESKIPVLVDFWAPWCGPCQLMGPVLDTLAGELEGRVKVVKLDVDSLDNREIAAKYNIRSIPNMKLFRDGNVIHDLIGAQPLESLKSEIEAHL